MLPACTLEQVFINPILHKFITAVGINFAQPLYARFAATIRYVLCCTHSIRDCVSALKFSVAGRVPEALWKLQVPPNHRPHQLVAIVPVCC